MGKEEGVAVALGEEALGVLGVLVAPFFFKNLASRRFLAVGFLAVIQ